MNSIFSYGVCAAFSWVAIIVIIQLMDDHLVSIKVNDIDEEEISPWVPVLVAAFFFFIVGCLYGWVIS
jgi:hypothetical protein